MAAPVIASLFFRNVWRGRSTLSSSSHNRYIVGVPREAQDGGVNGLPVRDSASCDTAFTATGAHEIGHKMGSNVGGRPELVIHSLHGGASLHEHQAGAVGEGNDNTVGRDNDNVGNDDVESNNGEKKKKRMLLIHTYQPGVSNNSTSLLDSATTVEASFANVTIAVDNTTLMGLGMCQRQFATWVQYQQQQLFASSPQTISELAQYITTYEVDWENEWEDHIDTIRHLWKEERLVCENTNILSRRRRSKNAQPTNGEEDGSGEQVEGATEEDKRVEEVRIKSEQFRDALSSYAERMVSIVEDELSDARYVAEEGSGCSLLHGHQPTNLREVIGLSATRQQLSVDQMLASPKWMTKEGLQGWIEREYGAESTRALLASSLLVKSEKEQLVVSLLIVFYQSLLDCLLLA